MAVGLLQHRHDHARLQKTSSPLSFLTSPFLPARSLMFTSPFSLPQLERDMPSIFVNEFFSGSHSCGLSFVSIPRACARNLVLDFWSPVFDHWCLFSCHLPACIIRTMRWDLEACVALNVCSCSDFGPQVSYFFMYSCMYNKPQAFYCVCGKMCVCSDLELWEIYVCFSVCVGAYIICVSVRAVWKYAVDTSPLGQRVSH